MIRSGSFDFLFLAGLLNVTFSFHCHLSPPALDTGSKKEYGMVWFDRGSFDFFGRLAGFVHVTFSFQCPLPLVRKRRCLSAPFLNLNVTYDVC